MPENLKLKEIKELEEKIRHHNRLYFELHRPEISDAEFDQLVEQLKKLDPSSSVLEELGSDLKDEANLKKIIHQSPMLSLDKCYSLEDLMHWVSKFEGDILVSPKIDGCAVEFRYDENGKFLLAATRGDGTKGEDISENLKQVRGIPHQIESQFLRAIEVRGEVYMPLSVFKQFSEEFSNPRNLAAGAIKQKDPSKTAQYQLRFFAYDLRGLNFQYEAQKMECLKSLGFQVVESMLVSRNEEELQKKWEYFLKQRQHFDYELDGVVYKTNLTTEQERLGASRHHPRYAIAYKFQGDAGVTYLKEVEWGLARNGVITPVGIVEPVELSGAMVSRVSLHHAGMILKLGLTCPAKVSMVRRGGVIPHLEKVLEKLGSTVSIPTTCPSCHAATELREDFLYCTNAKKCRQTKIAELKHFVKVLEIDGLGDKIIEKLQEKVLVEDGADFFTLQKMDLIHFERMGDKLAAKLIDNIQAKRKLPLSLFLQALGITDLAQNVASLLEEHFGSLENICQLSLEELQNIHGIGPKIAQSIIEGLEEKKILIDKLLKVIEIHKNDEKKIRGPLSGKKFLFTAKLASQSRPEAERKVKEMGGLIAAGVNQDLDYLVVGLEGYANQEKGSKWIKAEKLMQQGYKIKIISEEEFLKMLL